MIISESYKKEIIRILQENLVSECEIWCYGSRVNGDAHEASDFDIIIRSREHKSIPKSEFMILVRKFRESNLPISIDIKDWYLVPEYFHKYIENKKVLLYKNF